jgi:hypothetical protein
MPGGYLFDENDDEGIFGDDPKRAAGDPDARADMEAESFVPGITMAVDADGFVMFPELEGEQSILDPPPAVDIENFICLGECRHYTENVSLVFEGPAPDSDQNVEIGRWCGKVRTWAEQTDLTEAEIKGCTAFEPVGHGDPDRIRRACVQNSLVLAEIRQLEIDQKVNLGICAFGPCESFIEMIVRKPTEEDMESHRWCLRLGGLGRLYSLRERPVMACTGWRPLGNNPQIAAIAAKNIQTIARYRKLMAEREIDEGVEKTGKTAGEMLAETEAAMESMKEDHNG